MASRSSQYKRLGGLWIEPRVYSNSNYPVTAQVGLKSMQRHDAVNSQKEVQQGCRRERVICVVPPTDSEFRSRRSFHQIGRVTH